MSETPVVESDSAIHSDKKSWGGRAIDSARRGAAKRRPSVIDLLRHFLPDAHADVPWQQNNNAEPLPQSTTNNDTKKSLRSSKSLLGSLRARNRPSFNWSYSRRPRLSESKSSNTLTGSVRSVTDKLRRKMLRTDDFGNVLDGSSPKAVPQRRARLGSSDLQAMLEPKTGRPTADLDNNPAYQDYRRRSTVDEACLVPCSQRSSVISSSSSSSDEVKVPDRSMINSPLPGTNAAMSPVTTPKSNIEELHSSSKDPLEQKTGFRAPMIRLPSADPFVNDIKPRKLRSSTHDSGYEQKQREVHFAEPMPARKELSDSTTDKSAIVDKLTIRPTYASSSEGYSSSEDEEGPNTLPEPLMKCFAPMDQVTHGMSVTRIGDKKLPKASRKAAELHQMPTFEKVKRQVIASTSCQVIEGNTFQVTIYKSGFWKGANYQLRPRGRYVPDGVDFPRVYGNHERQHLRESSDDTDNLLEMYGNPVHQRPDPLISVPSEQLIEEEAKLSARGYYELERCPARTEVEPNTAKDEQDRVAERKVSYSID